MDPSACLREIREAIDGYDIHTAGQRVEDLLRWISRGGFKPSLPELQEAILTRRPISDEKVQALPNQLRLCAEALILAQLALHWNIATVQSSEAAAMRVAAKRMIYLALQKLGETTDE